MSDSVKIILFLLLRFVLSINDKKVITDVNANDDKWHHITATWSSHNGNWQIYKDGKLAQDGTSLAPGTTLEGKKHCPPKDVFMTLHINVLAKYYAHNPT